MKNENLIHQGKTDILVWSLSTEETIEEPKEELKEEPKSTEDSEIIEEIAFEPVEKVPAETTLKDIIIEYLKENKIISSKPILVSGIMEGGFSKVEVEKEIEKLKTEGIIRYSRSAPRGWSLVS